MRTLNDIKPTHKLSAPKSVKTKKEMKWSKNPESACVIPAGTALEIYFSQVNPSRIYFEFGGHLRAIQCQHGFANITGINKCPSLKTLEKWSNDGVAKTITGDRTEPDGYGCDGSPSWLLAIGVI